MTAADMPDDLRRFILTSVPSVPYLEAILLLQREHGTAWTAPILARRLYLPEPRAADLLASLHSGGIVAESDTQGSYTYEPQAELANMLERLAQLYATNLVAVTDLIHSGVDRRAFQFADAFRLRKD
jgi:Mn-dependent DtxR family transcriptional regulator